MTNDQIAELFTLLGKLIDVHGESAFKSKAYANASFLIEKLPTALTAMPPEEIAGLKGIGDAIAAKIQEIITTGEMQALNKYLEQTPPGVVEMLQIKGLGPKKIHVVWQEMGIETMGELLYACNENRLTMYKGFGEKTQQNVKAAIDFFLKSQGRFLYQEVEEVSQGLLHIFRKALSPTRIFLTGAVAMHEDVVDVISFATDAATGAVSQMLQQQSIVAVQQDGSFSFQLEEGIKITVESVAAEKLLRQVFSQTTDAAFAEAFSKNYPLDEIDKQPSIETFLSSLNLSTLTPDVRRGSHIVQLAKEGQLPKFISTNDIRGIIHCHSDWSDGSHTLEQMARAAQEKEFEYLVISDHSKSAFYANGLTEERVKAQHQYVDELNAKLAPFKIFKSIECDILNEGQLDYSNNLLSTFDLVIASVHSNLKMSEAKAMQRLLAAIENPYTTILGHMTGRLLLSRAGYPVDHKTIIDACAANNVVIELNAHPRRLDMDWHWLAYALEKGVLISINPDAHSTNGMDVVHYGVLAARKGGLTAAQNLSSFTLPQLELFLAETKKKKGL
jgi:DNA polymerase (family X)